MKLVSMKLSKKEAKEEMQGPASSADKGPKYPYELRIRLDTEILDKLKLDLDKYGIGDECRIEAVGEVIGISLRERQGDEDREELEIQITEFAVEPDKKTKAEKTKASHLDAMSAPSKEVATY